MLSCCYREEGHKLFLWRSFASTNSPVWGLIKTIDTHTQSLIHTYIHTYIYTRIHAQDQFKWTAQSLFSLLTKPCFPFTSETKKRVSGSIQVGWGEWCWEKACTADKLHLHKAISERVWDRMSKFTSTIFLFLNQHRSGRGRVHH